MTFGRHLFSLLLALILIMSIPAVSGTGEIVETGSFVRALTMLESVMGLFYVAFVISKLVSPVNRNP